MYNIAICHFFNKFIAHPYIPILAEVSTKHRQIRHGISESVNNPSEKYSCLFLGKVIGLTSVLR